MREILFRGKRIDNGEWVYGFYGHTPKGNEVDGHFVIRWYFNLASDSTNTYFSGVQVIPETVGQYIGIDDKNGKKIFVGDIVVVKDGLRYGDRFECVGTIIVEDIRSIGPGDYAEMEVIGNITDDPELVESV